jgi:hypothetical protein
VEGALSVLWLLLAQLWGAPSLPSLHPLKFTPFKVAYGVGAQQCVRW